MKKGFEDPSQNQPGPASGQDLAGSPGSSLPFPLEEYILSLSDEEWKRFNDMLETPMTRSQFVKISKTVLNMVNGSSFRLVLPTFVRRRYEPESVSDASSSGSESGRSSSSSSETASSSSYTSGSASASSSATATAGSPMLRMKGALAAFRRKVAWRPPRQAPDVTVVHLPMSTIYIESDKRSARSHSRSELEAMTGPRRGSESRDVGEDFEMLLNRLFSNESIDHITQGLVGQVQGAMQDGGPSGAPVAAVVPEAVYANTEGALRNLLQPYFTPLVVCNSPEHVASQKTPIYGSLKEEGKKTDFARLTELLLAELENAHSAAVLGAEDNVKASPSHSVGQSCQSKTSILKTGTAGQESPRQNRRQRIFDLFSKLMVHQVMDKMHEDSAAAQQEQENVRRSSTAAASLLLSDRKDNGCFVTVLLLRLLAKMSDGCSCCGAERLDRDVLEKLIEDLLIEFTSSDPGGCPSFDDYLKNPKIQTIYRAMDAFLLKAFGSDAILKTAVDTQDESFDATLLAQLRKELLTQRSSEDPAADSFDATLLAQLSEELLTQRSSEDPAADSFDATLLAQLSEELLTQRSSEDPAADSFDTTLLAQLREELLTQGHGCSQGNVEDPAAPSTATDLPSLSPVPDVTSGKTAKKVRSKLKIFKMRSAKIAPTNDASDMGLASETTVTRALSDDGIATAPSGDRKEPRKRRAWYKKIFQRLSCFGGTAEI
ncbi:uncharacterized protein LOC134469835 [Engraulis encrasicolus]|uniref:uncharacterized protein LOC134469835 n=1 Tax=Engraulis encrasicolus TaxID=184585 RepID=UPI002FD09E52